MALPREEAALYIEDIAMLEEEAEAAKQREKAELLALLGRPK